MKIAIIRNTIIGATKIIGFPIKIFEILNATVEVCSVNFSTLRYLWSMIEQTQTNTLLHLNDTDLVKQLLKQLDASKLEDDSEEFDGNIDL